MSYAKPRIDLNDSTFDVIRKLSEGNPGAMSVIVSLIKQAPEIDTDSALAGFGPLMMLDNADIYGSRIWMLYKDVCGQNIEKVIACTRAVQLGLLGNVELNMAIDGREIDTDAILTQVKTELSGWTSPDKHAANVEATDKTSNPGTYNGNDHD